MTRNLIILFVFAFTILILAQSSTGIVSGFVFDYSDGESLVGANVFIKQLNTGATSNLSGYYAIPGVPYGEYTLFISYIGYKTETIRIRVDRSEIKSLETKLVPQGVETKEVVVKADSIRTIDKLYEKPISKIDLTPGQVNQIPRVIEADLLRSLQTLPGITSLSDFSSALYIRGGTPDQNLFLVDGTDVYNPEHAFGIFSTFNTNAIKKVELSKGGFGAEYGGRLSSVLNVTNLDGNRNRFEGVVNVSLLSASATLQVPIGSIGSLSGSLRRTYLDQTYARWVKEVPDYYFYDGNLKAFFDVSEQDKFTASMFLGEDNLDFRIDKDIPSFGFFYQWGNQTGSLNWKHIFGKQLYSSFWATYSAFQSDFNFESVSVREKNKIHDFSLKGALEYYYSNTLSMKFGFEQKYMGGTLQQSWESGVADVTKDRSHSIVYGSCTYKPFEVLLFEVGLRGNYFDSENDIVNFEPRLTAKYRLTETVNLKFATGYFTQYLNRIPRLFFTSLWTSVDENIGESTSKHFIFGVQKEIDEVYEFEAEVYYKDYKRIYQFNQQAFAVIEPSYYKNGTPYYESTKGLFNSGDGISYGLEILLRKDIGGFTGWLAYSLARTEYVFPDLNKGNVFIPRHDRSSTVNAVLNFDWKNFKSEFFGDDHSESNRNWLFTFSFVYSTGQPITVPASAYLVNTLPDWNTLGVQGEGNPAYTLYPSSINKYRLPAYIRLDAGITYEIDYGTWKLAPYLQVFNLGARKNVWFIRYSDEIRGTELRQTIEKVNMLPLLPSIGVNVSF